MATRKHLQIGVYVPATVQLLDLSPIDLFGMLDPTYLRQCMLPAPLIKLGIPSTIHYISLPENDHVELTAGAVLKITKTINDAEVQPGKLDILLVPGPEPSSVFEKKVLTFLRGHAEWRGENGASTDILGVCTSAFMLGESGVLDGKKADGPRALVPTLKKKFPAVSWVDNVRWVQDGNIWTSGGITNGQEMVAEYIRTNFPGPAAETVIALADVGDKGRQYTSGAASEKVWWLWQIIKALTMGNGKGKTL